MYIWGKKKDDRGRVIKDAQGQPVPLVRVENGMPAIVTPEIKRACLDRLRFRKHGKTKANYVLSGKLICTESGKLMHGESGTSRLGVEYFYYVCKATKRRYSVKKELIESTVADGVREMLEDKD